MVNGRWCFDRNSDNVYGIIWANTMSEAATDNVQTCVKRQEKAVAICLKVVFAVQHYIQVRYASATLDDIHDSQ